MVPVENEIWPLGIENTETVGSENIEITEWNETPGIITEKGHGAGKGNIEGLQKKNITMIGNDINEMNAIG